jgi:hypothetical protein
MPDDQRDPEAPKEGDVLMEGGVLQAEGASLDGETRRDEWHIAEWDDVWWQPVGERTVIPIDLRRVAP